MRPVLEQIIAFQPGCEQEEKDKQFILNFLSANPDAFLRSNMVAHMTASGWVTNHSRDKVLMVYHNIYNSWSWTGGHADGDTDLLAVAMRECREETGVNSVSPVTGDIFSLEVLTVDGHVKKGQYVSSHLHLNVTYLLEADENDLLLVKEDENSGVAWFSPEDALKASTEPWFVDRVYHKLIARMANFCASAG